MATITLKPIEQFTPRTRKVTSERLTALRPVMEQVAQGSPNAFTIVEGATQAEASSIVTLLKEHYDLNWTIVARHTPEGTVVQVKYDPANPRKVRTVNHQARNGQVEAQKATAKKRS